MPRSSSDDSPDVPRNRRKSSRRKADRDSEDDEESNERTERRRSSLLDNFQSIWVSRDRGSNSCLAKCCRFRPSAATTYAALAIHGIHPCVCLMHWLSWLRFQNDDDDIGRKITIPYVIFALISLLLYLLYSSVRYMWVLSIPEPPELVSQRRLTAVSATVLLDILMLVVEVFLAMRAGIRSGMQVISLLVSLASAVFSLGIAWIDARRNMALRDPPIEETRRRRGRRERSRTRSGDKRRRRR